jgi:hypothetical protein
MFSHHRIAAATHADASSAWNARIISGEGKGGPYITAKASQFYASSNKTVILLLPHVDCKSSSVMLYWLQRCPHGPSAIWHGENEW